MKQRWHSSWFFVNNAIRVYSPVDNFPVWLFIDILYARYSLFRRKWALNQCLRITRWVRIRTCSLIRLVHCVLFSFEKSHNRDIFLQHGVLHITELFLDGGRVSHLLLHEIHDICGEHSIYWKHSQPRHRAIENIIFKNLVRNVHILSFYKLTIRLWWNLVFVLHFTKLSSNPNKHKKK